MLYEKYAKLVKNLQKIIPKYSSNSKTANIIKTEFIRHNMLASHGMRILTGRVSLETLDIENQRDLFLLFVFTDAMHTALLTIDEISEKTLGNEEEYSRIKVEDYFTELEISTFKDFVLEKKEESRYPYIFKNMIQVEDSHWVGRISAIELEEINAANDIIYNFATQRDPVIDIFGLKKIRINKKKVSTIYHRLMNDKQIPDSVKLNVLKDGTDNVEFITKDGIYGDVYVYSGEIDNTDGNHRKNANSLFVTKKPNASFNWIFEVTHWNEFKAQQHVLQINEQLPMSREHTETIDKTKNENLVVDSIVNDPMSELAQYIKETDAELKHGGLTTRLILSNAIADCYTNILKNKTQIKDIAEWIVEFTNYLLGSYEDEFLTRIKRSVTKSYINHPNMFMGYIALSAELYEQTVWKNKLKDVMSSIDFSIDNDFWKQILIENDKLNQSSRKKLYSLFRKEV